MLSPSGGASSTSEVLYVSKSISDLLSERFGSRQQAVEIVAQPIITADGRQEPGPAGVERVVGKLLGIVTAGIIGDACDRPRGLPAEIGHHCDAAAIAAEAIMKAVALSHVRQRVEG